MTRTELNDLPTVRPLLEAWRAARAERDRIMSDGRYGFERQLAAERAVREAEDRYVVEAASLTSQASAERQLAMAL